MFVVDIFINRFLVIPWISDTCTMYDYLYLRYLIHVQCMIIYTWDIWYMYNVWLSISEISDTCTTYDYFYLRYLIHLQCMIIYTWVIWYMYNVWLFLKIHMYLYDSHRKYLKIKSMRRYSEMLYKLKDYKRHHLYPIK